MKSATGSFCSQCAKVDFDFFSKVFQEDGSNEALEDISWSTFHPDKCCFCQLLLHCLNEGRNLSHPLEGTLRGVYDGNELQFYRDDEQSSRRLDYSIRRCRIGSLLSHNEQPKDPARFDVGELKFWLSHCEKHQCLPSDHSQHPPPEKFRLVDVYKKCIVRPKGHVKYCALSYVWGGISQPCLTVDDGLETENCLTALDLPKTIIDAMALCRDIGCQFLWVDSLCVISDSEADKHCQIRSMADVYSQSFLAIMAATGDDANAGLPPYGSLGRSANLSCLVRETSNGSFVASLSPQIAASGIADSTLSRRGWCLQEYALSRRVLFFTGSYTFFRCEKGLWCEDFGLGFSNCFEDVMKWDLPLPPFYRRKIDPDRHYSSTYSQLLAQFIRRDLRYDDDILAAFTGILTRMSYSIGAHIWGLPSREIGAALQWTTHLPFPTSQRAGFPSWSWAGWKYPKNSISIDAAFDDVYEGYDDKTMDMSVLTCYTVSDNRHIRLLEEYNLSQILLQVKKAKQQQQCSTNTTEVACLASELRRLFDSEPRQEIQAYLKMQCPSQPPTSHHLFIWASCASLYIDRISEPIKDVVDLDFPIRTKRGARQIGSICLRPEWRELEPDYMDFFVSTVGVYSALHTSPHFVQLKFTIILVLLLRNTKPPVYKRIQVSCGGISWLDWKLANPRSCLIALV